MSDELYSLDELDAVLREDGRSGYVGVSAIDGLVAALVAGPATVTPETWLPLIFAGRMPEAPEGSPARRIVDTIRAHYSSVEITLATGPRDYTPMFMNHLGQVIIEDWVIVGGLTPIHQFVRIGAHAFVGGGSRVPQDVPPYCRAAGNPLKLYGLNTVGLDRRGLSSEVRKSLKQAYRILFQSDQNLSKAIERAQVEVPAIPEVRHLLEFIRASERGITL